MISFICSIALVYSSPFTHAVDLLFSFDIFVYQKFVCYLLKVQYYILRHNYHPLKKNSLFCRLIHRILKNREKLFRGFRGFLFSTVVNIFLPKYKESRYHMHTAVWQKFTELSLIIVGDD